MAFRASLVACSKASRLPMSSKQGNKDFYKGAPQPAQKPRNNSARDSFTPLPASQVLGECRDSAQKLREGILAQKHPTSKTRQRCATLSLPVAGWMLMAGWQACTPLLFVVVVYASEPSIRLPIRTDTRPVFPAQAVRLQARRGAPGLASPLQVQPRSCKTRQEPQVSSGPIWQIRLRWRLLPPAGTDIWYAAGKQKCTG